MKPWLLAGLMFVGVAAPAQEDERWQLTLNSGKILWELQLVGLERETLMVRHGESTYRLPIGDIDELRLIRKTEHRTNAPRGYGEALGGAGDQVYRLTLYSVTERRQILEQVLRDHPPPLAASAAPRGAPGGIWQITLKDGTIVWDLRLKRLEHDTLVFGTATGTARYPLLQVDELRLVRAGEHEIGPVAAGGRYEGAANGASDLVYRMTLLDLHERREVVQAILGARSGASR